MIEASIQEAVKRVAAAMLEKEYTLTTAESCTGGGIAELVTSLPGSSKWFERGFVTYCNAAKKEMLGVKPDTLGRHGPVSKECAAEMAAGAINNSHADVALSVTGLAGPDAGISDKSVGTVCFGWAKRGDAATSTRIIFAGDRLSVRRQSILMSLQGVLDVLEV